MPKSNPPKCSRMGSHCQRLTVTVRVSSYEESPSELDHEATWHLGHTERMTFGVPWKDDGDLYCDTVIHVPCRFLQNDGNGISICKAYGWRKRLRGTPHPGASQKLRKGESLFKIVQGGKPSWQQLKTTLPERRSLPIVNDVNPCATASCKTSDRQSRAACCRDMQIEIMCTKRELKLESLLRTRKAPYLCKVVRDGDHSVDAEIISACGYLGEDGVACSLHGRVRRDGRPAKPELCSHWPPKRQELHPGCVFAAQKRPKK